MGAILKLLTGASGGWWLLGGALAAAIVGAAGGYAARGVIDAPALSEAGRKLEVAQRETAEARAAHEAARADGNAKVVKELTDQIAGLRVIIADLDAKRSARDRATANFIEALSHAPNSSACAGSPAERLYRDSVQPYTPAVP